MPAKRRWSDSTRSMRDLALCATRNSNRNWSRILTRFAVEEMRPPLTRSAESALAWARIDAKVEIDRLTDELTPQYGTGWLKPRRWKM